MRFVRLLALVVVCSASASAEVGQVSFFLQQDCPAGWLPLNGQFLDGSTYNELETVIKGTHSTYVYLPDVNGYYHYSDSSFIRGWAPSNRSFWLNLHGAQPTRQEDAFQGHRHQSPFFGPRPAAGTANFFATITPGYGNQYTSDAVQSSYGIPRTASETRPKNFAFLACVQAIPSTGIIEREVLPVEAQNFLFAIFFVWLVIMGYKLGKG